MTDEELIAAANERRVKKLIKQAKAEAYKEIAERLKEKYKNYDRNVGAIGVTQLFTDIENILKEMEGGLL